MHHLHQNLQREFIVHLLKRARRSPALEVYQYQMQMFLDSLARYLDPADRELFSGAPFTMLTTSTLSPTAMLMMRTCTCPSPLKAMPSSVLGFAGEA